MIQLVIIGTGSMANLHARSFREIDAVNLYGVYDIDSKRAAAFAKTHNIDKVFTGLREIIEDKECTAVSIVTPDKFHAPIAMDMLSGGKHTLCEKPLATNSDDARKMASIAKESGLVSMVNLTYRNSSAWQRLFRMVQGGELGAIRHVEASYLQSWLVTNYWGKWKETDALLWRLSRAHGSEGVLGDLGVHILDFACSPVGKVDNVFCRLKNFPNKAPDNKIGNYLLDANDSAYVIVEFSCGAMGAISMTRLATGHQNSVRLSIHGEKGAVRLDLDKSFQNLEVSSVGKSGEHQDWETLNCAETPSIYQRFSAAILSGKMDKPDFSDGAKVQVLLDACHQSDREGKFISIN